MQSQEEESKRNSYDSASGSRASAATTRTKISTLRIGLSVTLGLLLFQFLMGMWLNLFAQFPTTSTTTQFGSSMMSAMMSTMMSSPLMLIMMVHMMNGYLLFFLSIAILAVSLWLGRLFPIILAAVGLVSVLTAGISGLSFMFSGFQNNLYSYTMAAGFISAFTVYFGEMLLSFFNSSK
jgi:hypothetical protein